MPSLTMFGTTSGSTASGGLTLTSGNVFSGTLFPIGGIQLKYSNSGLNQVFVCLPTLSGMGAFGTLSSGGVLSSGGLADGMEMNPGDSYFVPKERLTSGIETIRVQVPIAASGGRLFWEWF